MRRATAVLLIVAVAAGFPPLPAAGADEGPLVVRPEAVTAIPNAAPAVKARSLVPIHSSLLFGSKGRKIDFSAVLNVHNADHRQILVVDRIEYRDSSGAVIEAFEGFPVALKPYASLQILIKQNDTRGDVGSSLTVDWSSTATIDEPLVEAALISTSGVQGFSLVSQARRVSRPD